MGSSVITGDFNFMGRRFRTKNISGSRVLRFVEWFVNLKNSLVNNQEETVFLVETKVFSKHHNVEKSSEITKLSYVHVRFNRNSPIRIFIQQIKPQIKKIDMNLDCNLLDFFDFMCFIKDLSQVCLSQLIFQKYSNFFVRIHSYPSWRSANLA